MAISLDFSTRSKKARIKLPNKSKPEPEPEYLTVPEAAKLMRVTPGTVRRLVRKGQIECARVGNRMIFSKKKIKAYLDGETS